MFHRELLTSACQRALKVLQNQPFLADFYLAGGTALALQIGHRVSTDLDWFTCTQDLSISQRTAIRNSLEATGEFEVASEQDGMLFSRLCGAEVSFLSQHHPLIHPVVEMEGIRLASPTDIGLMKLAAVNSRGTRRDFVDLFCLRELVTLDKLLDLVPQKYADRPNFLAIAVRALAYFEDAESQPMPRVLWLVDWIEVRRYCESAAVRWARQLSGLG